MTHTKSITNPRLPILPNKKISDAYPCILHHQWDCRRSHTPPVGMLNHHGHRHWGVVGKTCRIHCWYHWTTSEDDKEEEETPDVVDRRCCGMFMSVSFLLLLLQGCFILKSSIEICGGGGAFCWKSQRSIILVMEMIIVGRV